MIVLWRCGGFWLLLLDFWLVVLCFFPVSWSHFCEVESVMGVNLEEWVQCCMFPESWTLRWWWLLFSRRLYSILGRGLGDGKGDLLGAGTVQWLGRERRLGFISRFGFGICGEYVLGQRGNWSEASAVEMPNLEDRWKYLDMNKMWQRREFLQQPRFPNPRTWIEDEDEVWKSDTRDVVLDARLWRCFTMCPVLWFLST